MFSVNTVLTLLSERDAREKVFDEIIQENVKLFKKNQSHLERVTSVEKSLLQARTKLEQWTRNGGAEPAGQLEGPTINEQKLKELETLIVSLKDERSELYKTQGQNAQRVLDVNDLLKKKEIEEADRHEASTQMTTAFQSSKKKVEELSATVSQKNGTIQILQDELATLQLELVKTEERMKDMQKENGVLLNRWLAKMNEEAEKMNEANKFYESIVETSLRKAEASEPIPSTPNSAITENLIVEQSDGQPSQTADQPSAAAPSSKATAPLQRSASYSSAATAAYYLGSVKGFLSSPRGRASSLTPAVDDQMKEKPDTSLERLAVPVVVPKRALWCIQAHDAEIHDVRSSFDGSLIATGGADTNVKVFDAANGTQRATLIGATQSIMCVDFNTTGDMILGASGDNSTRIWNLATSRIRDTLTGHVGKVFSAKFNSDSSRVISGSHDRTVKLWDLQRGYCIRTIFSFSSCNDVCLADAEGSTVLSAHLDNAVRIWDIRSGNCVKEITGLHSGQVTSISVSNNGHSLLTNSRDNTLNLIDLRTYSTLRTFSDDNYRVGMNWSRTCLSPDGCHAAGGSTDGQVYVWNTTTGDVEKVLKGKHTGPVCATSWNPGGWGLVSADKDKSICMWTG